MKIILECDDEKIANLDELIRGLGSTRAEFLNEAISLMIMALNAVITGSTVAFINDDEEVIKEVASNLFDKAKNADGELWK